jgi:uncharacterized glyoxalase superfamily protein PhnB
LRYALNIAPTEQEIAMADQPKRPTLGSSVYYEDARSAIDWLEKAFGFERSMIITDAEGRIAHAEMTYGDGYVMIGSPWADFVATPSDVGGKNTQNIHVQLTRDIDAHCERARMAGAKILQEPEDQFYGDRSYRAMDPGGHVWTFGQTVKLMKPEEWDAASDGLKTELYRG